MNTKARKKETIYFGAARRAVGCSDVNDAMKMWKCLLSQLFNNISLSASNNYDIDSHPHWERCFCGRCMFGSSDFVCCIPIWMGIKRLLTESVGGSGRRALLERISTFRKSEAKEKYEESSTHGLSRFAHIKMNNCSTRSRVCALNVRHPRPGGQWATAANRREPLFIVCSWQIFIRRILSLRIPSTRRVVPMYECTRSSAAN